MQNIYKIAATMVLLNFAFVLPTLAGNPDRSGQAGASELLINPWASSSGWGNVNVGGVRGVEGMFNNVAGTAFTKGTEIDFSHINYLKGTGITLNSFGLTQRVGESGVLGIAATTMSFGDIDITTTDQPDGGLGRYTPNYTNVSLSYAKEFSHSIYGGINVKGISESISNLAAYGMALDAGIQYVTGKRDEVKFGVTLKNIGPTMRFTGDGLYGIAQDVSSGRSLPYNYRTDQFELPAALNIGLSYDFLFADIHRLTIAGAFNSNSFSQDTYIFGAEYGFLTYLAVRAGWTVYGKDNYTNIIATTYKGPSTGFSVQMPVGKSGLTFGVDYSYRATNYFDGVHSVGVRVLF